MYGKRINECDTGMLPLQKTQQVLALIALIGSLLGNFYLAYAKPTSDISDIRSELKIINYRLERIDKKIGL